MVMLALDVRRGSTSRQLRGALVGKGFAGCGRLGAGGESTKAAARALNEHDGEGATCEAYQARAAVMLTPGL